MLNVEPICPGCRIRRRLFSASGADSVIVIPWRLPDHLRNCPARLTLNLCGIAVETFEDALAKAWSLFEAEP